MHKGLLRLKSIDLISLACQDAYVFAKALEHSLNILGLPRCIRECYGINVPLVCQNAKGNVMDAKNPYCRGVCNGLNPVLGLLRCIRK